jgi:hypothetical protein
MDIALMEAEIRRLSAQVDALRTALEQIRGECIEIRSIRLSGKRCPTWKTDREEWCDQCTAMDALAATPDETQHATEIPAFVAKVLVDQDAECARLRKAIEDAQCSANCRSHLQRPFGEKARAVFDRSCNCWKSKALEEKP